MVTMITTFSILPGIKKGVKYLWDFAAFQLRTWESALYTSWGKQKYRFLFIAPKAVLIKSYSITSFAYHHLWMNLEVRLLFREGNFAAVDRSPYSAVESVQAEVFIAEKSRTFRRDTILFFWKFQIYQCRVLRILPRQCVPPINAVTFNYGSLQNRKENDVSSW